MIPETTTSPFPTIASSEQSVHVLGALAQPLQSSDPVIILSPADEQRPAGHLYQHAHLGSNTTGKLTVYFDSVDYERRERARTQRRDQ